MGTPGKRVCRQRYRGFESHPVRHFLPRPCTRTQIERLPFPDLGDPLNLDPEGFGFRPLPLPSIRFASDLAVENSGRGLVVLMRSRLQGGPTEEVAIRSTNASLYLRDVVVEGSATSVVEAKRPTEGPEEETAM